MLRGNLFDYNKVSECYHTLQYDSYAEKCYFYTDYEVIATICDHISPHGQFTNDVDRSIARVQCIQQYQYLVGSGAGIIALRKQVDGSSFELCSGNVDCPYDEYCSIQGVGRCEKIVSTWMTGTQLVNESQMIEVIKNNVIKSAGDTHSHTNSVTLKDGRSYIVRDVSVLSIIRKYYTIEQMQSMELRME